MRLFIAIELDRQIKQALISIQDRLSEFSRQCRWAKPEQMHLTLKFLGEVPDEQVEAVCAAAGNAAAGVSPFDFSLADCGCFPPRGAVRIVHCSLTDQTHSLQRCRDLCEDALAELGFDREQRPFSPHLTVGRVKQDNTGGGLRSAVEGVRCREVTQAVDAVCVVRSQLAPTGARYTNLVRHKLSGSV